MNEMIADRFVRHELPRALGELPQQDPRLRGPEGRAPADRAGATLPHCHGAQLAATSTDPLTAAEDTGTVRGIWFPHLREHHRLLPVYRTVVSRMVADVRAAGRSCCPRPLCGGRGAGGRRPGCGGTQHGSTGRCFGGGGEPRWHGTCPERGRRCGHCALPLARAELLQPWLRSPSRMTAAELRLLLFYGKTWVWPTSVCRHTAVVPIGL